MQHVGSSPIRDRICVSCTGRWILNHWTTGEALNFILDRKASGLWCWRFSLEALVTISPRLFWLECGLPLKCLPREMQTGPSYSLGFFVSPKMVWIFPWFHTKLDLFISLHSLLSENTAFWTLSLTPQGQECLPLVTSTWTALSQGHRVQASLSFFFFFSIKQMDISWIRQPYSFQG